MTELDPSLNNIPSYRIIEASVLLAEHVGHPVFDALAGIHGRVLPPAGDVDVRLAALVELSAEMWDLRGKQGGVERQAVNMNNISWTDMPGLADINKPDSPVAKTVMALGRVAGLVEAVAPPDGVDHKVGGALGAYGLSGLHRQQHMFGHRLSLPTEHGLQPSVPNPNAHPSLKKPKQLYFTLGADRPVKTEDERAKIRHFAPDAQTEFDINVAAGRYILGEGITEETYDVDAGYETRAGDTARVTVQTLGDIVLKHFFAPTPTDAERDRAQTQHGFTLLRNQLSKEVDKAGNPLLNEGDAILFATNAIYGPFQSIAAANHLRLRAGWRTDATTYIAEDGGITRQSVQLLPELRSYVRHLEWLGGAVLTAVRQRPEFSEP